MFATKPSRPFCAAFHNCNDYDIDQYRKALNRYYADLEQYIIDVDKYREKTHEYARCQAEAE